MEFRKTYLLGVVDNTILTCEIDKRYKLNNCNEVGISFNVGELIAIDDIDEEYLRRYFEEEYDDYSSDMKIWCLQDGDITKDEWLDRASHNSNYKDVYDCSCTDYEITVNDNNYNFETICGGQHDIRKEDNFKDFVYTNKQAFDLIMKLWDNYHIKNLSDWENERVDDMVHEIDTLLSDYDCKEFENNKCYEFVVKMLLMNGE